jgi:hypothetical protein
MDKHNVTVKWKNRGRDIVKSIAERLFNATDGGGCLAESHVPCFTMLKVGNDHVYRAHPCFLNERPCYDCVIIHWSVTDEPMSTSRIEMFLDMYNVSITHENMPFFHPEYIITKYPSFSHATIFV